MPTFRSCPRSQLNGRPKEQLELLEEQSRGWLQRLCQQLGTSWLQPLANFFQLNAWCKLFISLVIFEGVVFLNSDTKLQIALLFLSVYLSLLRGLLRLLALRRAPPAQQPLHLLRPLPRALCPRTEDLLAFTFG